MFGIFQFVLVLVGKVPLELIPTRLFNGCGAYCINNSGSLISVSVILSVVSIFEYGPGERE